MDYWKKEKSAEDVHHEVKTLFNKDEDLLKGFEQFLPKSGECKAKPLD
jgi:histone deacetylase complex regulatory component SIN3